MEGQSSGHMVPKRLQLRSSSATQTAAPTALQSKNLWSPWLFLWQGPLGGPDLLGCLFLPSAREISPQPPSTVLPRRCIRLPLRPAGDPEMAAPACSHRPDVCSRYDKLS